MSYYRNDERCIACGSYVEDGSWVCNSCVKKEDILLKMLEKWLYNYKKNEKINKDSES